MNIDEIRPFIRGASLMKWIYDNKLFSVPYDCRIFAIHDGEAILSTKSEEFRLRRGAVMFFGPAMPYKFKNVDKPFPLLTINLDLTQNRRDIDRFIQPGSERDFDESRITERPDIKELSAPIILRDAEGLCERVHELYDEYQSRRPLYQLKLSAMATDIIVDMIRRSTTTNSNRDRLISTIKRYVHDNFSYKITNESIAAALGYHPYYLARIFSESEGVTLHRYITNVRLRFAKQLLYSTTDPVEFIAESCGFTSSAQFSAAFRAKYGCSPTDIRKNSP